ncbi:MAG: four-helix bundle copper-binding protein [Oligoflexia bacterium]|nr:four-helix bundle copper-binding protein [Oligoflexia bacterium]
MIRKNEILSSEAERCAVECLNCHSICLRSIRHCLGMGGKHAEPDHIGLLVSCAELCQTTENFLLTSDPKLSGRVSEVCAEACETCAASCDGLADDPQMKSCAAICRSCAASCREIAGIRAAA